MASKRFIARFGVDNGGNSITNLGGGTASSLALSGNFAVTITSTAASSVTLPTSGTLSTLAGTEALTNKTINGLTISSTTGTLTIGTGSTLVTAGAFSTTLTSTAATNVTLPTTGTLATLTGTETLTNKTISGGTLSGTLAGNVTLSGQVSFTNGTAPIISAKIGPSTTQQHTVPATTSDVITLLAATQALTNKTVNGLTISTTTGTLSIGTGSTLATSGAFTTTLTSTAATSVTLPTTGTLATLGNAETFTGNKTFSGSLTASGAVSFATGTNNQSYSTTGAGTISISSATAGTINNMSIGATTASTGRFTTLTTTGAATIGTDLTVTGNLTVSGTTTAVNSTTVTVNDPVLTLSNNSTATADTLSRGIAFKYGDGTAVKTGFFGLLGTGAGAKFTYVPDASETTGNTFTGTAGSLNISTTDLFSVTGTTGSATVTGNAETISFVGSGGVSTSVSKTTGTTTVTISAAGAQNTYSNISDGTTTASAGSTTDTIRYRAAGTGLAVTVGSNDATFGDNVLYTVTSTANADATSLVARDANGESAFRGVKLNTASTTTAGHLDAATATFATAGEQIIATFSGTTYKVAKLIVRAGQGANFQAAEVLVVTDGSASVNHTEYAYIDVGTPFAVTYNASISGGTVSITADAGATSTVYTVQMIELV